MGRLRAVHTWAVRLRSFGTSITILFVVRMPVQGTPKRDHPSDKSAWSAGDSSTGGDHGENIVFRIDGTVRADIGRKVFHYLNNGFEQIPAFFEYLQFVPIETGVDGSGAFQRQNQRAAAAIVIRN